MHLQRICIPPRIPFGHIVGYSDISNNVGPVKHFLSRPIQALKRVFSSASWVVLLVGFDDFGSLVI